MGSPKGLRYVQQAAPLAVMAQAFRPAEEIASDVESGFSRTEGGPPKRGHHGDFLHELFRRAVQGVLRPKRPNRLRDVLPGCSAGSALLDRGGGSEFNWKALPVSALCPTSFPLIVLAETLPASTIPFLVLLVTTFAVI